VSEFLSLSFHDTLVHFVLTETCLERHKSFVLRLSRTAVLYVIYLSWVLGGYPPNNGHSFNLKLPSPHPHQTLRYPA
jgi:hypothetical protein